MKPGTSHRRIAWTLLLYFALFVIPPVSSFAAAVKTFGLPNGQLSFAQDHRHAKMYLVDIVIWLKLKQSCKSDTVSVQSEAQTSGAQEIVSTTLLSDLLPEQLEQPVRFSGTLSRAISGHLSRTSDIYFARSGIAPPFLS